jgi:hypothetical protein
LTDEQILHLLRNWNAGLPLFQTIIASGPVDDGLWARGRRLVKRWPAPRAWQLAEASGSNNLRSCQIILERFACVRSVGIQPELRCPGARSGRCARNVLQD